MNPTDKQSYYEYLLTLPRSELEQMLKDVISANDSVNQFERLVRYETIFHHNC